MDIGAVMACKACFNTTLEQLDKEVTSLTAVL